MKTNEQKTANIHNSPCILFLGLCFPYGQTSPSAFISKRDIKRVKRLKQVKIQSPTTIPKYISMYAHINMDIFSLYSSN